MKFGAFICQLLADHSLLVISHSFLSYFALFVSNLAFIHSFSSYMPLTATGHLFCFYCFLVLLRWEQTLWLTPECIWSFYANNFHKRFKKVFFSRKNRPRVWRQIDQLAPPPSRVNQFAKIRKWWYWRSKSTVNKNSESLLEWPTINGLLPLSTQKRLMTRNCWYRTWTVPGGNKIINFHRQTKRKRHCYNIWQNTWPTFFMSFTSVIFLSLYNKSKTNCIYSMCAGKFLGVQKDFCPYFPKLARNVFVCLLFTNFLPQRTWRPIFGVTCKKRS